MQGGCYDGCNACESCACGNCGCPGVKKYLLIHNREHEECGTKCVVAEQGCPRAPCVQYGAPVGVPVVVPPMPPAEGLEADSKPLPPGK